MDPGVGAHGDENGLGTDSQEYIPPSSGSSKPTNDERTVVGRSLKIGLTYNLKRIDPKVTGRDVEAEFDPPSTIEALAGALRTLGHEIVEIEATPEFLTVFQSLDVDLVFNIAEGIKGRNREAQVPAILDLLGIPYTGSDPTTLAVALDKGLAKRLVRQEGIPTADFFLMMTGDEPIPARLSFPLIAKPVAEGSSKGIVTASVVRDEVQLRGKVREILAKYDQPAIIEAYLPGREFTVAILGDENPRALPPMEILFSDTAGDLPVYSFTNKLSADGTVNYKTPADVDPALGEELADVALRSFLTLGCRDVARVDLRCDGDGRVNFMECNPLPGMTPGWSDLCLIAEGAGMTYLDLVDEILTPAVKRLQQDLEESTE